MHRYMANAGFPSVRTKVAEMIGRREGAELSADRIVMTVGAASGLNVALRALLDPGDEVVVLAPIFAEYRFYVMHAGGECRIAETTESFDLDLDRLASAINERTRVVLLNSPNNPTGRVYSDDSVGALCELLKERSRRFGRPIVLLSDEPYRKLVYDGVVVPTLFDKYDAVLVVASFSKDLGLAGERIGYLAMHPNFPEAAATTSAMVFCLRTLGFVNAPAMMQLAIADSLEASVDVESYRVNRYLLCDGLSSIGYELVRPEGAFFLFPRTPIADDVEFCRKLAAEHVLAVPGVGFGRRGHMRLSYAVAPQVIERAMPCFGRAFRDASV
jgi:aspartate aminotransferase